MPDTRTISERYAEIGARLVAEEPALAHIRESGATIVYLSSTARKVAGGRPVLGQCERVPEKYLWAVPCDFTVTVFEPNVEGFTDEQLRILVFHELLHVGIDVDEDGAERYRVVPHDLEDFKEVVRRFGADWAS